MRWTIGIALMVVAAAGCNSGGGGGGGGGGADAVLTGKVFDCTEISGATIEFRIILPGTNTLGRDLGTATSDANGNFTKNFGDLTGWVHADATGGSFADPFQGNLTITERFESIAFVQSGQTSTVVISASTTVFVGLKYRLGRDPATPIATDIYNVQRIAADFTGHRGDIFTTVPDFNPSSAAGFDSLMLNIGLSERAAQMSINPSALARALSRDAFDYDLNGLSYDEPLSISLSVNYAQQWATDIGNAAAFFGYDLTQTDVDETLQAEDDVFIKPPASFVGRNLFDPGDGSGMALIWGAGLAADNDVWFVSRSNPTAMMQAAAVTDQGDALGISPPAGLTDVRYDILGENMDTGIRWYVNGFRVFDPNAVATVAEHEPKDGPVAGGTRVRFRGANLHSGTMVQFNGTSAVHTNSKDGEWLECATPAGLVGDVDISLTNPGASPFTISAGYRYLDKDIGLTAGFDDRDQISLSAKFEWDGLDFKIGCTRFLLKYTTADSGTFEGTAVSRSMMNPDPTTQLFDGDTLRADAGRDRVIFTFGEGFNRVRANERSGDGYGLRDNGFLSNYVAATGATDGSVNNDAMVVVGFVANALDKEFTTFLGVCQFHEDGTGEISGDYSTRKTTTGDVEFGAISTDITDWSVTDPNGLIAGQINVGSESIPFNAQLDSKFNVRYAWGGCPGQMVLLYTYPVGDGIEPQDATGNWVGGSFRFNYDESFPANFAVGGSLDRFTIDAALSRIDIISRTEGDLDRTQDGGTRFDESLRHDTVRVNTLGLGFDPDTGERLNYISPRLQGYFAFDHPDPDGLTRELDFTWGAGGFVPERYTADSISGVHHKLASSGFSPVVTDPPDFSRFYAARNTTRNFDPTTHLNVDGRALGRTGTLALNQSAANVKRADRVSGTGQAFFFLGTELEPETPTHYFFQDDELLLLDALFSLGSTRKGAVTADCATIFVRDFGTGGTNNFVLFTPESTTAPPCANGTYCIGGIFVEFDDDDIPAGATVQTIRGEVQLDVPTPGDVTLELDFFRKSEDGNEDPPSQQIFVGTYTCDATGTIAINIPGEDGDPDVDLEGFATPDGQMIYLHDRSAIPQVGIAMGVRKGPGTPPLINYNVAGIDVNFLDTPSIPRRTNLIFNEAIVSTTLPGALNVLGISRTRGNFTTGVAPGQTVFQANLSAFAGGGFAFNLDPAGSNQQFLGALSTNGRYGIAVLGNPDLTDTSIRFFFPK